MSAPPGDRVSVLEQAFQNALMVAWCRIPGVRVWRQPAGNIPAKRGGVVKCAPPGAADVTGVAAPEGWRLELEVKGARTPTTDEQERWAAFVAEHGAIYLRLRFDPRHSLEGNVERGVAALTEALATRRARRA